MSTAPHADLNAPTQPAPALPEPVAAAVRNPARLAALRATGLLDTPSEPAFDRLTRLAVNLLRVPAAFLSLVDEDRDFYKSSQGFGEPLASNRELTGTTFCHFTVAGATPEHPLVIPDTRADPLYGRVPTVESLGVAAYLGVPLMVEGQPIGSMCVIDSQPRAWTPTEVEALTELAASAQREIELRMALDAARRNAAALERTYREREELLDATNDGVYTVDGRGRCLYANRAAAQLLGYEPDELIGRNAHELFHHSRPDGTPYPPEQCPIAQAGRTGRAVLLEDAVLWRRDGTPLPVAYASAPVRREGRVVGAVVRFTDITEWKRSAEGLRLLAESGRVLTSSLEVDETLQAIAHLAVPELAEMVMVDVLEDGAIRRVAASHADERVSALFERARQFPPRPGDGGPQAQVIESGRSLLVTDLGEAWVRSLNRGAEHADLVREMAPRSLVVVPLAAHQQVLGTISLVRGGGRPMFDERDRSLAEELGRRAALAVENARLYEAARNATRARDDMLGVVSHDLRNPIHSIAMASSFLLDPLLEEERVVERKQAAVIKRAAERANRLIQDLLDITHIEGGRLSLECLPQSAASLADEAAELARMPAAERGITLARGRTDDAAMVIADRDRMLQALENLIGNAIKFTPAGGRVTLAVECGADEVRISVADTGPGIPEEHLPRLFDRYWQASRRDRRGVGLGLSIVKGIAEAHRGRVEVESTVGAGTTFTLVLPAAPSQPRS